MRHSSGRGPQPTWCRWERELWWIPMCSSESFPPSGSCAILEFARNYSEERLSSQVLSAQPVSTPNLDSAWLRFLRAHAALTRELSSRLEALHELTLSDFDVLI